MPQFVILFHEMPAGATRASHWDFMVEQNGVLMTWALEREPRANEIIEATRLPDHRLAYLDYEGEVSAGRGNVTRYERGEYCLAHNDPDHLLLTLCSQKLIGRVTLDRDADSHRWRFSFVAAAEVAVGTS